MEVSRFFLLVCVSWSLLMYSTHEMQPSQTQVLLQLRKQLEYPQQLNNWVSTGIDLCYFSTPQVNITCQDNFVTQITIFGDKQTLSQNFSMDSVIATLSRLNSLKVLRLVSLGIWGPIPDKIRRLQFLEYLDLSWNFMYGSVPNTISRIVKLQVLKLDGNFLNGSFPDWFDSFSNLTSLSLSSNRLTGPLPSSLRSVTSLTDINLSNNLISGKLLDLSSLSRLIWLDLSNNTLTGSFPMNFSCSSSLEFVDISNNRLRGQLPSCLSSNVKNRVIKFGGNCFLIDTRHQHPETYCVELESNNKKPQEIKNNNKSGGKNKNVNVWILVGVIGGIAIVLGVLAFGFLVLCRQYCPRGTSEQHLLHNTVQDNSVTGFTSEIITNARFISDAAKLGSQGAPSHRLFLLDELKEATKNFDKSTLMGEGSTGKIYKGRLENGPRVAIRCIKVSRKFTIRNLKLRLDLLAKLRHPHLVCLLGHCIEIEGKDESGGANVYLVYENVPNGNYRAHLSETNSDKVLKWSDRLSILVGIAKAVHFLHTGIIPGFFSNRLKANNILLNEHRMGKLSDYGLSVVAQEIDKNKEEDGLKSWQTKSLDDDIYSFGLILLESLIGPSVLARKESFLLNEMVSLGNQDGQKRIVDPTVLASCSQESLSIVISLTINCISPESSNRPSFEDVLWNLQYAAQVQGTSDVDNRP
ncbi:hypothetical protein BUALT_Bualt07G0087000 [Buddleja alternifolia]|uniref:Protein kinase domain-containing protein n=1 Tax=Buddleja alternifolia TaxID=168488 RepID=A0AAV6X963_9LAMI|nr:hypothetical protein BUALT_Bualt07G0087000 [Buddleja alternifolia]